MLYLTCDLSENSELGETPPHSHWSPQLPLLVPWSITAQNSRETSPPLQVWNGDPMNDVLLCHFVSTKISDYADEIFLVVNEELDLSALPH